MTCAEFEIRLCDYLDGTLAPQARDEFEQHMAECAGCAELARDAGAAISFMERVAEPEPPPELLTRILFHSPLKAQGRTGIRQWVRSVLNPVLQPRLAMSMALTILSFAMLARFIPMQELKPADLNPSRIWAAVEDRGFRAWERKLKFYDSLKVVYQIQSTLREWRQQQDEEQRTSGSSAERTGQSADQRRLPVAAPSSSKGATERQR